MTTHHTFKALLLSASFLLTATSSLAANIPLLNHNFESDAIPPDPGYTTRISGWVNSGTGTIGVYAPESQGFKDRFHSVGNRGQVNFIDIGGRMSQTTAASLLANETYTLSFDTGKWGEHDLQFVARIKANGLVIAQLSSSEMDLINKEWTNNTLSFTATQDMPIGTPIVIEFANLQTQRAQVNLDNITFSTTGTATTLPGTQLGALTLITQDATLLVPDQFPNINVALRYLDDKQIKVGKTVTIQVTDCDHHVYTESVEVAHPNGRNIQIIGDTSNPQNCLLQFNDVSGFSVTGRYELGLVDGFSIRGNDSASANGVQAIDGGIITLGENVQVSHFLTGVLATRSAKIHAAGVMSSNNAQFGFRAITNSSIDASNALAENNNVGFGSGNHSQLRADHATARNNPAKGFVAAHGGTLTAQHAQDINSGQIGYQAWLGSQIQAHDATSTGTPQAENKSLNSEIYR